MKTGKTLKQLAEEIERQQASKLDLVAPTDKVTAVPNKDGALTLQVGTNGNSRFFGVNDLALRQIGEHNGIPARYLDRMKAEAPALLAENINTWMHKEPVPRMLRTLDGNVRAFLSDRYRPLENNDLAEAVLPVLLDKRLSILSCEITERRLYIKAVDQTIERQVPKGAKMGDGSHVIFDCLSPGIVISNSEVGLGALSVETSVWTKACTNLAIFGQRSMRKYHVGGKHEISDGLYQVLTEKTRRITDAATWSQVRDVVGAAFDEAKFDSMVGEIRQLTEQRIEATDVVKVVKFAEQRFGLTQDEGASVLKHLIEGADLTRYGLFNAITRTAEDLDSYDRSTEFERLGGEIIDLPANDWQEIANAA